MVVRLSAVGVYLCKVTRAPVDRAGAAWGSLQLTGCLALEFGLAWTLLALALGLLPDGGGAVCSAHGGSSTPKVYPFAGGVRRSKGGWLTGVIGSTENCTCLHAVEGGADQCDT